MKIRMTSKSGKLPEYKTKGASGFDISAYLDAPLVLGPGERALVPTGLFIEVPEGYEAQVRARRGLAVKHGIGLVNGIGTIDSDYRGEIRVPLINWGDEEFRIESGDRIAQVIIVSYEKVEIELSDELSDTERGEGGFGHTGI